MTDTNKPLKDIIQSLDDRDALSIRLLFITRSLKAGIAKNAKMLEKYVFQLKSIDTDAELQRLFLEIALQQITGVLEEKQLRITEYETIDDDTPKVYSYDFANKAIPFREVVKDQIKIVNNAVTKMNELLQDPGLWAYCVEIRKSVRPICLTFTKLYRSRIAIDESDNPERSLLSRFVRAKFNVKAAKLELLEGNTINFDKRIDCVYSFDTDQMYVLNKSNFEKIVSLEEEFREIADQVTAKLKKAAIIDGLENVADELEKDTVLHKRLYKLAKTIEGQKLDQKRVQKMALTIKQFKIELQISNGKVQVKTKRDLDEVIKLLEDYYLQSDQTGYKYGASVKKKL